MMAAVHSFILFMPAWNGILLLIAVWTVFRVYLLRSRKRTMERMRTGGAVDLVELISQTVALKRRGRKFVGLCPFHSEKTPSFTVDPVEQTFYCFGCKASGSVFDFIMMRDRRVGSMPPPLEPGQIRCPRCSAGAPGVASYCPHCGLAMNSLPPPPSSQGQFVERPRWSVRAVLIWASISVIGFTAYIYWRMADQERLRPPAEPYVRIREGYNRQ